MSFSVQSTKVNYVAIGLELQRFTISLELQRFIISLELQRFTISLGLQVKEPRSLIP